MPSFPGAPFPATFAPTTFSEVKAWYRVEDATMTGAEVETLPAAFGGATFQQNLNAPGPAKGTTANGLSTLVFTSLECLVAPSATPAWQNANYFGLAFWFKPSQETSQGDFFSYYGGSTGLADNRINCRTSANTRIAQITRDSANTGNRQNESLSNGQVVFKTNVWQFLAFEFEGSQATEATRNRILVNGGPLPLPQVCTYTDLTGTPGGASTTLRTTTASPNLVTLGARQVNQGTSAVTGGVRGAIGPDIFFYDPSMGRGKLQLLMNYRVPRG